MTGMTPHKARMRYGDDFEIWVCDLCKGCEQMGICTREEPSENDSCFRKKGYDD